MQALIWLLAGGIATGRIIAGLGHTWLTTDPRLDDVNLVARLEEECGLLRNGFRSFNSRRLLFLRRCSSGFHRHDCAYFYEKADHYTLLTTTLCK